MSVFSLQFCPVINVIVALFNFLAMQIVHNRSVEDGNI